MSSAENKLIDLECRSRRNNLIFHGVKESNGEDPMQIVHDIIHHECRIDDTVILERAHRLGKRRAWKNRPIIVKFLDYNDKMFVKSKRFHLPQSLSISDDLPISVRQAQHELLDDLHEAKRQKKDAFIRFPATLVVDGKPVRTVELTAPQPRRPPPTEPDNDNSLPDHHADAWQPASQHNARRYHHHHHNTYRVDTERPYATRTVTNSHDRPNIARAERDGTQCW